MSKFSTPNTNLPPCYNIKSLGANFLQRFSNLKLMPPLDIEFTWGKLSPLQQFSASLSSPRWWDDAKQLFHNYYNSTTSHSQQTPLTSPIILQIEFLSTEAARRTPQLLNFSLRPPPFFNLSTDPDVQAPSLVTSWAHLHAREWSLYLIYCSLPQARRERSRSPTPGKYLGSDRMRRAINRPFPAPVYSGYAPYRGYRPYPPPMPYGGYGSSYPRGYVLLEGEAV